jgi:hypothetical protein
MFYDLLLIKEIKKISAIIQYHKNIVGIIFVTICSEKQTKKLLIITDYNSRSELTVHCWPVKNQRYNGENETCLRM